jgi:predicted nucleic acid-binding protein
VVIVDTTVWIDYLNGVGTPASEWLDREVSQRRLGLLDLMVCEILQGLATEGDAARVLRQLQHFEIFRSGGLELAVNAAENSRRLRREGRTVRKTIGCLIATFCLVHGHSLLHADRDFDPFEEILGLEVVRP